MEKDKMGWVSHTVHQDKFHLECVKIGKTFAN